MSVFDKVESPPERRQRAGVLAGSDRAFFIGLARAFAGALIFSLPMLMTMEMWWIGFHIDFWRLVILLVVLMPLLTALSRFSGFKRTTCWRDDVADAFVAVAVALATAAIVLSLFNVLSAGMPVSEIVGKIAIQAFPASFGAILARAQTGEHCADEEGESYSGELLIMAAGALFLGLNVAPTEEMVLISYMMGPWRELALIGASLLVMHAFVFAVDFPGEPQVPEGTASWSLFLRFTVTGYVIVLLISTYLLWTFGSTDGMGLEEALSAAIVLGFPCSIGAAAARIIL